MSISFVRGIRSINSGRDEDGVLRIGGCKINKEAWAGLEMAGRTSNPSRDNGHNKASWIIQSGQHNPLHWRSIYGTSIIL